jgi:hypothetical protein
MVNHQMNDDDNHSEDELVPVVKFGLELSPSLSPQGVIGHRRLFRTFPSLIRWRPHVPAWATPDTERPGLAVGRGRNRPWVRTSHRHFVGSYIGVSCRAARIERGMERTGGSRRANEVDQFRLDDFMVDLQIKMERQPTQDFLNRAFRHTRSCG